LPAAEALADRTTAKYASLIQVYLITATAAEIRIAINSDDMERHITD